jgi:hypothetical protein
LSWRRCGGRIAPSSIIDMTPTSVGWVRRAFCCCASTAVVANVASNAMKMGGGRKEDAAHGDDIQARAG